MKNSNTELSQCIHQRTKLDRLLLPGGNEPDPRFTLANERTFLAWLRTALALMGGALVINTILIHPGESGFLFHCAENTLFFMGVLTVLTGCVRWFRTEHAIRHNRPLSVSILFPLLTVLISTSGGFIITIIQING